MDPKVAIVVSLCLSVCLSTPPHIVILLADDVGWNDVGFHGSEIPTPNIDALAYSGIVLRRHYAQPSCTPSRAALMTGQYPMRYGLNVPLSSVYDGALPSTIKIMPQVLKPLGYQTHIVGKWHLGYTTWSHMPTRRGFDSFFGYLNGFLGYYDGVHFEAPDSVGLDFWSNETESWPMAYSKYLPELLSNKAQAIVRDHKKLNKDKPLFLLMAANAPHTGNRPFREDPPPVRGNAPASIEDPDRRVLADVMRYVDDTLGNLTMTLKSEGMLENTLLIFLSDNGGPSLDPIWGYQNGASNFPFRSVKLSAFEGGVRVPAILWKSGLNSIPKTYDNLFHITDWLPTLNSAAGGGRLEGLDGVDQWAALTGTSATAPRNELLVDVMDTDNAGGYLKGDFKFVKSFNGSSAFAFTNDYFSPPPVSTEYQVQAVQASNVARAMGMNLDADIINHLRNELMVNQSCSEEDRKKAGSHDCSEMGCLFDLSTDPNECFDIAAQHTEVMNELIDKWKSYKGAMVHLPDMSLNFPNSKNYFSPSSGNEYLAPTLMILLIIPVLILLKSSTVSPVQ